MDGKNRGAREKERKRRDWGEGRERKRGGRDYSYELDVQFQLMLGFFCNQISSAPGYSHRRSFPSAFKNKMSCIFYALLIQASTYFVHLVYVYTYTHLTWTSITVWPVYSAHGTSIDYVRQYHFHLICMRELHRFSPWSLVPSLFLSLPLVVGARLLCMKLDDDESGMGIVSEASRRI